MATKAELQAELAELKREMGKGAQTRQSNPAKIALSDDAEQTPEADTLHRLLDQHGIDADTLGSVGADLLEELTELQKDKPLIVLAAAFALGVIIGRTVK